MKKAGVIASVVVGVLAVAAQIYALPQQGGPQIKLKASKSATKAAAHAKVLYSGPPQFAGINGTSITYATNASQPVLKIGDTFYFRLTYFDAVVLTDRNVWLVSASAQGPWTPARFVPQTATEILCAQLNADPFEPSQLCTLPWTDVENLSAQGTLGSHCAREARTRLHRPLLSPPLARRAIA